VIGNIRCVGFGGVAPLLSESAGTASITDLLSPRHARNDSFRPTWNPFFTHHNRRRGCRNQGSERKHLAARFCV
jgi:hypothetical protein